MLMRPEAPIEHRRLSATPVKELLILAVIAVMGVAVALGVAHEFPVPADTTTEWLAQLSE
jgi:hypothetical protein